MTLKSMKITDVRFVKNVDYSYWDVWDVLKI